MDLVDSYVYDIKLKIEKIVFQLHNKKIFTSFAVGPEGPVMFERLMDGMKRNIRCTPNDMVLLPPNEIKVEFFEQRSMVARLMPKILEKPDHFLFLNETPFMTIHPEDKTITCTTKDCDHIYKWYYSNMEDLKRFSTESLKTFSILPPSS